MPRLRALQKFLRSLVTLCLLVACTSTPRGPDIGRLPQLTSNDPHAEAELREAQRSAARGKSAMAQKQFRAFLHAHPEDALVPVAQLSLGRLLLAQRDDGEARALFASVAEHPDAAVSEQGRFYAGVTDERLGRHAEAVDTLKPMLGRTIEPEQTALLLDTLTDAYSALRKYADAIRVLSAKQNEQLSPAERKTTSARLTELIDHKANPAEIQELLKDLDGKSPAFRQLAKRALRDADAARDAERVREIVELLREQQVPLDAELSAIALRSQNAGVANANAVGAILSLSGRARRVGELALRGLMQAAGLPPQGPTAPDAPNVIFRDDAGDVARAVQAVDELANVHRVIAIIGPMDGQIAAAAGKRAQELSVPLIALSPAGSAPDEIGEYVFRYFPTPDAEAKALASAARKRGAQSFATLYPNNAYGQAMAAAFEREAVANGLHQATTLAYLPTATSFGTETDTLKKERFDALFIPDSADHLAMIAPALAAAGMWSTPPGERASNGRGIVVLAPSVAYHPNLPRQAGRYLQGACFAVPFNVQADSGEGAAFVRQFQEAFGSPPDAFAAYAHDAYRLVRSGVEAGAVTREALARQLRTQRTTGLVAPGRGFDSKREALQPVEILELRGAGFAPLATLVN